MLQVNDEPKYPTFFHQVSPTLIQSLRVTGKIEISFVGFGEKGIFSVSIKLIKPFPFPDMVAAPPVGFNLTFVCPDGQVNKNICICQDYLA